MNALNKGDINEVVHHQIAIDLKIVMFFFLQHAVLIKKVALLVIAILVSQYSFSAEHKNIVSTIEIEIQKQINIGEFHKAIFLLNSEKDKYISQKNNQKLASTLVRLADIQYDVGEYKDAESNLLKSLSIAKSHNNPWLYAKIYGGLGNIYISLGQINKAKQHIDKALEYSKSINSDELSAVQINNLGNAYLTISDYKKAEKSYQKGIALIKNSRNSLLRAKIMANLSRVNLKLGKTEKAEETIAGAIEVLRQVDDSHDKLYLMINLARTSNLLADRKATKRTYHLFSRASEIGKQLKDVRATSYADGYLGELYEQDKRFQEALILTDRAIFNAQQLGGDDSKQLLFLWYWQNGRLYEALGQDESAIEAYQLATQQIQSFRHKMQVTSVQNNSSFEEQFQPVYMRLVNLLLKKADKTQQKDQLKELLLGTRNIVEELKAAELRNYFQDQCIDDLQASVKDVDAISDNTAVVYPIILKDRIELLISYPDGEMKKYSSPVGRDEIEKTVFNLRVLLEKVTTNEFRLPGNKLYEWLVKPYELDLATHKITTLVFVPDGILRTVPMSALYNKIDKTFLIEKYEIAITPGIELTDPKKMNKENVNVLYGGLSQSVQGYSALEYVPEEINFIHEIYGGKVLLDEFFRSENIETGLSDTKLNILHIATHAQFGAHAEESYILTYDARLTIDELANYIGLFKFRDVPLDLLVLSACETARGDQRSALGLSGVAIKAGARSALGALWKVTDAAANNLMQNFYSHLHQPGNSRAASLQKAQLEMLKGGGYEHPAYWSSYILINNWL